MTVENMRSQLIQRYSKTIRNQRVDLMPDEQVIAIYHSLIERKDPKIGKPKTTARSEVQCEQLSFL